jgi:hypothetical protein
MVFSRLLPLPYLDKEVLPTSDQVKRVCALLDRSRGFMYSLGGEAHHSLWQDPEVSDRLEARSKKIKIFFACGPSFDVQSTVLARLINLGRIIFYHLPRREKVHHFQVSDTGDVVSHRGNEHDGTFFSFRKTPAISDLYMEKFLLKVRGLKPVLPGEFLNAFAISDPEELRWWTIGYRFEKFDTQRRTLEGTPASQIDFDELNKALMTPEHPGE